MRPDPRYAVGDEATLVSIFSVMNCGGRLLSGALGDWAVTQRHIPRPYVLAGCSVLMSVASAALLFGRIRTIYVAVTLGGLAYGGVLAIAPAMNTELFGLKHCPGPPGAVPRFPYFKNLSLIWACRPLNSSFLLFSGRAVGANYMAGSVGMAAGSYVLATLVPGYFYEAAARDSAVGGAQATATTTCVGPSCFFVSAIFGTVGSLAAAVFCVVIGLRASPRYALLYRRAPRP